MERPMKSIACVGLIVLAACSGKSDPASEARAALEKFQGLVKSGKKAEAMAMIVKSHREEIEKSGMADMALGMLAAMDYKDFKATVEGDKVIFTKEEKQGNSNMSVKVTMVKEDGQWKIGQ